MVSFCPIIDVLLNAEQLHTSTGSV